METSTTLALSLATTIKEEMRGSTWKRQTYGSHLYSTRVRMAEKSAALNFKLKEVEICLLAGRRSMFGLE